MYLQKPKINFTNKDIEENLPDGGLQDILKVALENLNKLNIDTVVQGDMLFKKDTVKLVQ